MAAVCATEQYQERISANPANRDYLMGLDANAYIEVMSAGEHSSKYTYFKMSDKFKKFLK